MELEFIKGYSVTDNGEVYSLPKRTNNQYNMVKYKFAGEIKNKHLRVTINDKHYYIHKIVAKAFPEICGEWFDGCEVHHKDFNPLNNRADNLIVITKEEHRKLHSKPIRQYTLDGQLVAEYYSIGEAARKNNYSQGNISYCLLGIYKTSYGYIWRYKEAS